MIRNVGAAVFGLLVGMTANRVLIEANMAAFPPPPEVDPSDFEQLAVFIGTLPPQAFVLPIVAHMAQAFFGGWIAARLAGSRPMLLALIVGGLSLVAGLINLAMIPHPVWMWIEVPGYVAVAWAAGTLEVRRRERLSAS